MRTKLLRKIQAAITAEPKRLNMEWLHSLNGNSFSWWDRGDREEIDCKTAHCIVGWGAAIKGRAMGIPQFSDLIDSDVKAVSRLAFVKNWPLRFRRRYELATKAKTRAAIACEVIDHFIATEGKASLWQS